MTPEQIALLLQRPTESLNVEVKTWLDLRGNEAIAKLVKGLFALKNRNGGTFVVGFDDKTLQPDPYGLADPVTTVYHPDRVQELVSRFANVPFEVAVSMGVVNGIEHPVITVPAGVRVPIVVKRDLFVSDDAKNKKLLAEGDVYFRTLGSNGRVSSSVMRPGDWVRPSGYLLRQSGSRYRQVPTPSCRTGAAGAAAGAVETPAWP